MSQNVNVNLVPGNYPKEFHVSQYDVGRQLVANIVDSTGAYSIPSGATVTLVGTKPSGFGFTLSGSVGSGGVVTFSTTATVTAEYGRIPCEIRITSGSTILGTANCMLIVEESPHPEGTTDGDGEQIINEMTLLLQQMTEQAQIVASGEKVAPIKEAIDQMGIAVLGITQSHFEQGTVENGVKASTTRRIRLIDAIEVRAGDVLYINSPTALYYNIFLAESYADGVYSNIKYKVEYIAGTSTNYYLNNLSEVYIPFDGYLCIIAANGPTWNASTDIRVSAFADKIALVRHHGEYAKENTLTFEGCTNAVYVKAADGTTGSNSSTGATDYIDISEGYNVIVINNPNGQTHQGAFYDADKAYVGGYTFNVTTSEYYALVPPGAKYVRLSYVTSLAPSYILYQYLSPYKWLADNARGVNRLKGKRLGIVGDSISTYSGFNPSGYATFYPRNTVINVEMTWWKQLLDETGMELCVNASWSGSTISGDTTRTDGYVGCSDARVNALTDGQGNTPDIIIVWMGINDFGKTNGITCGSYDGTTAVSTATNITAITEAYGVLLKKLETEYPEAQIFVCRILPEQFSSEMAASFANGFPNINPNDNISLPELNDRIEQIANAFGCGVIPMDKCGATFFNINTYTGDGLHPNALLTPKMCEVAKQTLLKLVN